MVWYGMVWYGMVCGMVWYVVWYGMVWYGLTSQSTHYRSFGDDFTGHMTQPTVS